LALLALALISTAIRAHWQTNPAWSGLLENASLCSDIDGMDYWKDSSRFPLPLKKSGKPVDISTCQRVAWATAGMRLIEEHPFGYGLINHSFGALAALKWDDFVKSNGKTRGATHSGLIDFTLGFGLPGLLLVMIPLASAYIRAYSRSGYWYVFIQSAVPMLILVYTITEVCTGHFIELLFFLIAFFLTLTLDKKVSDPPS
jgi:hypothetical protein